MSELFEKSLRTLELPRVLRLLAGMAVSAEAKERALRISPETEAEEVLRLLDQTDAARQMIGRRGAPSFSGVKPVGEALDRAAHTVGVNFIGGYSALVQKGFGPGDYALIETIPEALAETELVCSSVNVGSTKAGINMDAVEKMGRVVRETAQRTAGGQPLYGRGFPRPRRAGLRD